MAAAVVVAAQRVCNAGVLRTACRGYALISNYGISCQYAALACSFQTHCNISASYNVTVQQRRQRSFFNKLTANELWKGVAAENTAGGRKGRGKRGKRKKTRDLNRGQVLGEGKIGFLWPGLNAPLMVSGKVQSITQRNEEEQKALQLAKAEEQKQLDKRKRVRIKKERGWTGRSWGGVSLGLPDPGPNGETFEDFDSRVLEVRSVFNMTSNEGRKRSMRALVAVGNGKGSAGFALGKAAHMKNALRKAKNKAIRHLHYVERYEDHTIYHDIAATFKKTTIRMKKQNKGYGLRCHRAIITLCKLIGIKNMYARVYGSKNILNLTTCLFKGLANQETHQKLADKKKLYVVEFRDECGPLPIVVGKPNGPVREDPEPEEAALDVRLEWKEVKATQGMRSKWADVKRAVW
uniref:Small ribosomal subunit protein uS5m n=1 Tax=Naja naja TaxID=35670 RepID=A0A8C6VBF9_NAJNA